MRDLRHSILFGVSVIALTGLPHSAAAADKDLSRFDLAFSAGGAYLSLPAVNRFSTAIDNGPFVFLRQFDGTTALQEIAPSVSLHLGSPDFDSRFFGGAHVNFDINGVWVSASEYADTLLADPPGTARDEFLDVLPINGASLPSFPFPPVFLHPGLIAHQHVTMDFWQADGAITLEGPATRAGPAQISFLAGPRLAYQQQDYGATITDGSGHSSNRHDLDESVSTFFGGPEIGFRSVMPLAAGGDFHIVGRAAALWYGANLDAHQRLNATDLDLDLSRRDSNDDFSARLELASGVAVPIPNTPVLLTLDGNVVWWSAVPQVVNPSSGPGIAANDHAFSPVHLGSDDMFMASLTAGLKIPLP